MNAEKMTITLDTEDMRTVLASVGFVVCDWKEKARDEKSGKMARRALLLWPLVCTGGNGSGGVRPGAGGGADLLAVPVGMVSAGTVPGATVPASRLALAVLHPGRFLPFAGGVRFST